MKTYDPNLDCDNPGCARTATLSETPEFEKRVDALLADIAKLTNEALASRRLWVAAAENIQRELDQMRIRAETAEATAVWAVRDRVYYEAAGVISEGPLIVIPEACSTDKFPFSSFDCLDDDADVYRVLQEARNGQGLSSKAPIALPV